MSITNIDSIENTDTFGVWKDTTNQIIAALADVVTIGAAETNSGEVVLDGSLSVSNGVTTDTILPLDTGQNIVTISSETKISGNLNIDSADSLGIKLYDEGSLTWSVLTNADHTQLDIAKGAKYLRINTNSSEITASGLTIDNDILPDTIVQDLRGDIYANNSVKVLENGATRADAWFTGNILNDNGGTVLENGNSSVTATLTGNVTGDLTGEVYASNGTYKVIDTGTSDGTNAWFRGDILSYDGTVKVLENTTLGTTAWFKGDVISFDESTQVLENSTDGTSAWFRGDIKAQDGTDVLSKGSDGTNAWFKGDILSFDESTQVLENSTDGTSAWFKGDILSYDASTQVLENSTDGTSAWFRGDIKAQDGTNVLTKGSDGTDAAIVASVTIPSGGSLDASGANAGDISLPTGFGLVPPGVILMWSGSIANIPPGWTLCDGSNGTPNLRDRFIVGAGDSYNPGDQSAGTNVFGLTASAGDHNHDVTISRDAWGTFGTAPTSTNAMQEGRLLVGSGDTEADEDLESIRQAGSDKTATTTTAGSHAHSYDTRPPYYALAYIMKLYT